jgi:hypothetical protein
MKYFFFLLTAATFVLASPPPYDDVADTACANCSPLNTKSILDSMAKTQKNITNCFVKQFENAFAEVKRKQESLLKQSTNADNAKERLAIEQAEIKDVIGIVAVYEKKLKMLDAEQAGRKERLEDSFDEYNAELQKWLKRKNDMIAKDFGDVIGCLTKFFNKYNNIEFNDLPKYKWVEKSPTTAKASVKNTSSGYEEDEEQVCTDPKNKLLPFKC